MNHHIQKVNFPPLAQLNSKASKLSAQGKNIINLGQAVPGFSPPEPVIEYARSILGDNKLNVYSPDPGLPKLLSALCEKLRKDNSISCCEDEIVVTAGANSAFLMSLLTILNSNDEVILFSPYYFNHAMTIEMLGGKVVEIPMKYDDNFFIDKERILSSINKKTKCIVIVSPCNPTGAIIPREDIIWIYETAVKNNIYVITDETYEYFTFDSIKHFSLRSVYKDNVISLFSFSKSFALAGYRIGFAAASNNLIKQFLKAQDNNIICAPVISQLMALKALECRAEYLPKIKKMLESKRNIIKECFKNCTNIKYLTCNGAFFAMIEMNKKIDEFQYSDLLIEKHGIVIVPGTVFGNSEKSRFRIAFGACSENQLKTACSKIIDL